MNIPYASSLADPIVFTESIFMFLYPGRQMPLCQIKSLEYSCGFYLGHQMRNCQIKSLSLEYSCGSYSGRQMPDCQIKSLSLEYSCGFYSGCLMPVGISNLLPPHPRGVTFCCYFMALSCGFL